MEQTVTNSNYRRYPRKGPRPQGAGWGAFNARLTKLERRLSGLETKEQGRTKREQYLAKLRLEQTMARSHISPFGRYRRFW